MIRRIKTMRRRPRYARTRAKSLVAMIKKVAINQMEPKRHLVATNGTQLVNDQIFVLPLTRIPVFNVPTGLAGLAAQTTAFQGNQAYFKGIRVDGWIRNASQFQSVVNMWVVKNKTKAAFDVGSSVAAATAPIFYNPTTGLEIAYNLIPKFYQRHPKLHPKSEVTIVKKLKFIIDSSQRGEGNATVPAPEVPHADMADGRDDVNFRFYIPLNKTMKKLITETPTDGNPIKFQQEYAIWLMAEPMPHDVEYAATTGPVVSLSCITYFRD